MGSITTYIFIITRNKFLNIMSCIVDSGLSRGCRDNAGGMYTFYVASYPSGTTVSTDYLAKDSEGIVTGFTGTSTSVAGFYEFTPNKNSASFTENYEVSLENGTHGYNQELVGNFSKMEQSKQNLIDNLAAGTAIIIVKDKNGRFWLMGESDGAIISGGNSGTGTALSDLNGYNLQFGAAEGSPAPEVEAGSFNIL